ncbi:hypothetical protein WJX74_007157 [Apatococcus lobatus]|uniref:Uncharacterized protein n=1 Tax=Apatococcus lobatus TaxID=904363 RepID=A0AAW1QXF3_9CHLO
MAVVSVRSSGSTFRNFRTLQPPAPVLILVEAVAGIVVDDRGQHSFLQFRPASSSEAMRWLIPRSDFDRHHTLLGSYKQQVQEQQEDELSQLLHAVCYEPSEAKANAALELAKIASERLRESQQNCGLPAPRNSDVSAAEPETDVEVDFAEMPPLDPDLQRDLSRFFQDVFPMDVDSNPSREPSSCRGSLYSPHSAPSAISCNTG